LGVVFLDQSVRRWDLNIPFPLFFFFFFGRFDVGLDVFTLAFFPRV